MAYIRWTSSNFLHAGYWTNYIKESVLKVLIHFFRVCLVLAFKRVGIWWMAKGRKHFIQISKNLILLMIQMIYNCKRSQQTHTCLIILREIYQDQLPQTVPYVIKSHAQSHARAFFDGVTGEDLFLN
ncbi:hypothetical protein C1646_663990 [Rhizophagus diaphanus]|nr:hypothetical protein C1646_663990 [Rhizophagus diaphanus] [Rhizophagus sp. MUCL 43196]